MTNPFPDSLQPLLTKDQLIIPYFTLMILNLIFNFGINGSLGLRRTETPIQKLRLVTVSFITSGDPSLYKVFYITVHRISQWMLCPDGVAPNHQTLLHISGSFFTPECDLQLPSLFWILCVLQLAAII